MPAPLSSSEQAHLHELGIRRFNAGEFFAAHEAWEELWQTLPEGPHRQSYQVLIQMAVALELYRRSIPAGVLRTRLRYQRRLAALSAPMSTGIDLLALSAAMDQAMAEILATDPVPARGSISIQTIRAPRIVPVYNPYQLQS